MDYQSLLCSSLYLHIFLIRGVGCIFGEMLSGRALFQGQKDAVDQLNKIWQVLGTPDKDTWPEVVNNPVFAKGSRICLPYVELSLTPLVQYCDIACSDEWHKRGGYSRWLDLTGKKKKQ